MEQPLFSIITAVRNDREGFVRTLRSLQAQAYQDFEWIVIDGASEDGTLEEIRTAQPFIHMMRSESDRGVYDAMNKGLALAKGCYLMFLNAGDVLADSATLQNIAQGIKDCSCVPDFIYGAAQEFKPSGDVFLKRLRSSKKVWYGMFTHHQAMVYRREILGGITYNLSYPIGADYDFTLQVLAKTSRVLELPYPVCVNAPPGLSGRRAVQGRKDQYNIRRSTLRYSKVRAGLIFLLQTLTFFLKQQRERFGS